MVFYPYFIIIMIACVMCQTQAATRTEFAAVMANYLGLGHYRVTDGHALLWYNSSAVLVLLYHKHGQVAKYIPPALGRFTAGPRQTLEGNKP